MNSAIKLPDDLIGRWWFERDSDDSPGLLIIDEGGRAVQFYTMKWRLSKHEVMRLWYSVSDSGTIQFRPTPTGEGWARVVERTCNGVSIAAEDKVFQMWIARESELPEWFEEDYRAAVELMDAREKAVPTPKRTGE